MSQKKKTRANDRHPGKQQCVFREAWGNMTDDLNRFMPEKLRQRKGKKKFVLWLFVLEMVVLGGGGEVCLWLDYGGLTRDL